MALQIVIKLCQPVEKNIPLRSNYLFYHPETSKLEIKGVKNKHFYKQRNQRKINETGNDENQTVQYI